MTSRPKRSIAARAACALLGLSAAVACTGPGAGRPPRVEVSESGFTLTETSRIGPGARVAFSAARDDLEAGRLDAGIERLRDLTESDPHLTLAHLGLGMALRERGDLEAARTSLDRAAELSPRHPAVLNELGMLQRRQGQFEQARRSYEAALALHPTFHHARRNLAILCDLFLVDLECALEHYQRYAESMPDDADVAIWIADLRNRRGK